MGTARTRERNQVRALWVRCGWGWGGRERGDVRKSVVRSRASERLRFAAGAVDPRGSACVSHGHSKPIMHSPTPSLNPSWLGGGDHSLSETLRLCGRAVGVLMDQAIVCVDDQMAWPSGFCFSVHFATGVKHRKTVFLLAVTSPATHLLTTRPPPHTQIRARPHSCATRSSLL